jgi:hypothetical protein
MFKSEVVTEMIKTATGAIKFEDLSKFLPFQTRVVSGETFNHIQSQTVYDIRTYGKPSSRTLYGDTLYHEYTVSQGDTLCRRKGRLISTKGGVNDENCPGCLAIAHGIIKRDLERA